MVVGRTAVTLACLGLAFGTAPASAMQWQARRIIVKDPNNQAAGFYRIPWRAARTLNDERLEEKARRYDMQAMNSRVVVTSQWVIVPHCGEDPDASRRATLTPDSPSPFDVTCP